MVSRLVSAAVAIVALIGANGPRTASAVEICPCASNSPVINPFPFKWIRWGTSRVLVQKDGPACLRNAIDPAIAIDRISTPGNIQGYQLIVVDMHDGRTLCRDREVIGVQFVLSKKAQAVMVRQVAKVNVTPDGDDLNRAGGTGAPHQEYRLVYILTDTQNPTDSICTHTLHSSRRRWPLFWRFAYKPIARTPSKMSKQADDIIELRADHPSDYVVIIPNAEYDDNVIPHTPPSAEPLPFHIAAGLEWFEYACASGALAHTELHGLVPSTTDLNFDRAVRTAALRMFSATYKGTEAETVFGVPILFKSIPPGERATSVPPLDPCPADTRLEARWSAAGALCLSHSRLWMNDTVIGQAEAGADLTTSEDKFRHKVNLSRCGTVSNNAPDLNHTPFFTSCALNHITHETTPPTH